MLANDVTLRNLIPDELAKGFGFFQSKPATAFSPFAVTPDELGDAWRDGRVAPARAHDATTATLVGDCDAGPEMHFSFFDLIAHLAQDARVHRGHDPRQRHGVERGPRARHLVPRRAADDRDHRERQAEDAVHEARATPSRSRRSTPTAAARSARIAQTVVEARVKLVSQLLALVGVWRVRIALGLKSLAVRVRAGQHLSKRRAARATAYRAR